jgi:hypothetical protein
MPCRSYRLRDRLQRTTTADSRLAFLARRVGAASPDGTNTRRAMSAQFRQNGPSSSMTSRSPDSVPHAAHVKSLSGWMTARSGGADRRWVTRSAYRHAAWAYTDLG